MNRLTAGAFIAVFAGVPLCGYFVDHCIADDCYEYLGGDGCYPVGQTPTDVFCTTGVCDDDEVEDTWVCRKGTPLAAHKEKTHVTRFWPKTSLLSANAPDYSGYGYSLSDATYCRHERGCDCISEDMGQTYICVPEELGQDLDYKQWIEVDWEDACPIPEE